jgi:MGT family glycosyltransferase
MAKIAILNVPAHGHINPTLAVTQELVRRGEAVTYFATEPFRSPIEATGAQFQVYPELEGLMPTNRSPLSFTSGAFNFGDFLTWTLRANIALIPQLLDLVGSNAPDCIVFGNMFHAGRFVAQILKRPAIASFASLFQTSNVFGQRLPTPAATSATSTVYQELQTQLRQTYAIELPAPFQVMQWPADCNLVYTSREFQANAEQYDDRFVFVGPSIMQRPSPFAFPFDRLEAKPIVYISLGTIFNNRPDFYRLCLEAFDQAPYQLVMVAPSSIAPAELGSIPDNFIVQPYVPQLELFPRVSVFITHGGMSSVQEALSFGVPLVVFPQMREQMATAQRVAELGLGLMLSDEGLTRERLREAAEQVLSDPTFRQKAEQCSATLKAAGGYSRAADTVQQFTQQHQPNGRDQ